jgi:hypothetical protein
MDNTQIYVLGSAFGDDNVNGNQYKITKPPAQVLASQAIVKSHTNTNSSNQLGFLW